MKKSVAIVLCLALVFSLCLCGCGSEKKQVLGTWTTTIELADQINEGIAGSDPEAAEYLTIDSFKLILNMVFNEDDTYSLKYDEAAAAAEVEKVVNQVTDGTLQYLVATLGELGLEVTEEEAMELTGITREDLQAQFASELDIEALFADLNMEGNFKVKEGKMYLSDGLEYGVDETMYELYSVEGNTMTIDKGSTGDDSADFVYPMVFTKK